MVIGQLEYIYPAPTKKTYSTKNSTVLSMHPLGGVILSTSPLTCPLPHL